MPYESSAALRGDVDATPLSDDPLLQSIEQILDNWARWSRTRPRQGHCASIEHRFRTPNHFHPPSPNPSINIHSAMDVEREMRHMPKQHQRAIIWHFVYLAPYRFICRRLAVQHDDWPRFLGDSVHMIENRLRKAAFDKRLRKGGKIRL